MFEKTTVRNMKPHLILLLAILWGCNSGSTNEKEQETTPLLMLATFDWLIGDWERIENDSTTETYETWVKSNDQYIGHGYVLKGIDTVWQEHMVVEKLEDNWIFTVSTPGNDKPVSFHLTELDSLGFTVSNQQHDFPKHIQYWSSGKKLHALVTGDSTKLRYNFTSL